MVDMVELVERCREAAGEDLSLVSEVELFDEVRGLAAARAALDAREAHVLAELEVRGSCDREFGSNTVAWVAQVTGGDRRTVAARVKTGVKLRRFDAVDGALSDGRISFDHARVFAAMANPRIETDLAAEQSRWVALAERAPFRAWHAGLAARVELLDHDGGFDPERERARNRLTVSPTGDRVIVRGEFVGELALSVAHHLETATNTAFRHAVADHAETPDIATPTMATLRAETLAELIRRGATASDPRTAPTVDVTVVINQQQPALVTSPDRDLAVPANRVEHLLCSADTTLAVVDNTGVVLHLGRSARHANHAQRHALAIRDGGCVFPGCHTPTTRCDAHHVTPWNPHGQTDINNLALLCRHHHSVTHRPGWHMTTNPDQTFTWTTPNNHTLHSQRHHPRPLTNRPRRVN